MGLKNWSSKPSIEGLGKQVLHINGVKLLCILIRVLCFCYWTNHLLPLKYHDINLYKAALFFFFFFELQPLWLNSGKRRFVSEWHAEPWWDPTSSLGTKVRLFSCSSVDRSRCQALKGALHRSHVTWELAWKGLSSGPRPAQPGGKKRFYPTFLLSSRRQDPRSRWSLWNVLIAHRQAHQSELTPIRLCA